MNRAQEGLPLFAAAWQMLPANARRPNGDRRAGIVVRVAGDNRIQLVERRAGDLHVVFEISIGQSGPTAGKKSSTTFASSKTRGVSRLTFSFGARPASRRLAHPRARAGRAALIILKTIASPTIGLDG